MSESVKFQLDIRLILLGFFVALFSAGIGIGGGALLVSILMSVFGFDFKKAASTSLATIIPISFIGSASHIVFISEISHLQYYFTFIPACVLGTILGIRIVRKHQNGRFKFAFSLFLFIISLKMLKIFDFPFLIYSGLHSILFSNEWLPIVPIGIFIGMIGVSLGIGCGLLIVPFYVIVLNLNIHEAITLSLTTMFFLTLSATIMNNRFKTLDVVSLKSLFIPALAGSVVGAIISGNLPAPILKIVFGMFLFIVACSHIIQEIAMCFRPAVLVKKFQGKD
ncbi:MAG: sulfite exporter TauE/SafE family protein [Pseudomonadota bacterium]